MSARKMFLVGPNMCFFPTKLVRFPIVFQNYRFQSALPKGDRAGYVQEKPLVLQSCSTGWVFNWVVVVSILVGILSPIISAIWERPTHVLACMLTLRRWLLLSYQEIWKSCPGIVLLPLEKLMRLAPRRLRWIRRPCCCCLSRARLP